MLCASNEMHPFEFEIYYMIISDWIRSYHICGLLTTIPIRHPQLACLVIFKSSCKRSHISRLFHRVHDEAHRSIVEWPAV